MTIKALAFAASALALTASGASAADLAKRAPAAVDYVKVCDTYGEGFFYIPGSDTCLKIGGYIRFKAQGGDDDFGNYGSDRISNSFSTMSRLSLQFDARSNTQYGLLRSFAELRTEITSGDYDSNASTSTYVDTAYIQWGGLTAGKAQSFFDFWTGYTIEEVYGEVGIADTKANLLAYTFGIGNGVTATVSLEDSTTSGRRVQTYSSAPYGYGGNKVPDLVANINVTQAWGSAQVMAALHENNTYSSLSDDKLGYAVGAGVQINLPWLGAGDKFALQAVYAKGASGYAGLGNGIYNDDFYYITDLQGIAWSVSAGLQHQFTSTIAGAVQASYLSYKIDNYGYDNKTWDLSASVTWTPVTNLALDLGVEYRTFDSTGGYDADGLAVVGRITRTF